ncbi:hypothetical protein ACFL2T_00555 [Elusimicrobiota bacterium]
MAIKVGKPIDIQTDKRYIQHIRDTAIGDIYDALVELITNADDSYHRMHSKGQRGPDGGDILVEHGEKRGSTSSTITIRDKAEGMDSSDMKRCLLTLGKRSSEEGDRGYMGRGAKDCTKLGDVVFESIKDRKYYRCRLTHDLKFILEINGKPVTKEIKKELGLLHGNGTSVHLVLKSNVKVPRYSSLKTEIPWHYSLRDIASPESPSVIHLKDGNSRKGKPDKLLYYRPEGDAVIDESFEIPGYSGAKADLKIWQSERPLEDSRGGSRFQRFGIIIKGKRAIHECSLLSDEFKNDIHAKKFFGRIDCAHIDDLLNQFEDRREKQMEPSPANPTILLDPNRRFGLDRRHPFVKALLQLPSERLRKLVAQEKEKESAGQKDVANQETKSRLNKLSKLAGDFLKQQLDSLDDLSKQEDIDNEAFAKKGFLIYPTFVKLPEGATRTMTVYAKKSLLKTDDPIINISTDTEEALSIIRSAIKLKEHKTRKDTLIGYFQIEGLATKSNISVYAEHGGAQKAEALVDVIGKQTAHHAFASPLEFEYKENRIRLGSKKKIRLFAQFPDLVSTETEAHVLIKDSDKAAVRGRCVLKPMADSNFAEGTVIIEGRTIHARTTLSAEVNGRIAETKVIVIDKPEEDPNIPIRIEIKDEDYGNSRAIWADQEGQPNLLKISARHPSLSRYLGSKEKNYPGQSTPLFRLLTAEIVAESVCRKSMLMESKERPWEFGWAELKEDHLIADDVLAKMQQRLKEFVTRAHTIMLSSQEVRQLKLDA